MATRILQIFHMLARTRAAPIGLKPGSWAVVATWRRYFGAYGEIEGFPEQVQSELGKFEPSRKLESDDTYNRNQQFGVGCDYARSSFAEFARETRRSMYEARTQSPFRDIRGSINDDAENFNNQNDLLVDVQEGSTHAGRPDLRSMFLAQ